MANDQQVDIIESLKNAKSVAVVLPGNPRHEMVAAGTSLYLSIKSLGRDVEIACPTPMIVDVNRIVGVNDIKSKLASRNLVISFDYVKDAIEKVSYNVEDGKFNLVVQPKQGHEPLSTKRVNYSYSGSSADLVILVGTANQEDVKAAMPDIAAPERQVLSVVPGEDRSLIAEAVTLMHQAGLPADPDIASNLYQGLVRETANFQDAQAYDFEAAAALVRAGAKPQPAIASTTELPKEQVQAEPEPTVAAAEPIVVENQIEEEQPKKEWFGPKIFRSGDN